MTPKKITDILLIGALAILLFASGYKYGQYNISKHARIQDNLTVFNAENPSLKNIQHDSLDFSLFWDTWQKLEEKYIDEKKLNKKTMYYGAIKGMVASLGDPYTFFLTPEENKQTKDDLGGKLEGIGAQLGLKDNRIVVIAPMKNSPAEKAGLRAGDLIAKVDGKSVRDWTLAQTVSKIRGKKGTKVVITILRVDKEREFEIVRDQIQVPSIELSYESRESEKVAHLKINLFGDTTNDEWDKAAAQVRNKWDDGQIKGVVLDVRNNPGGYLESAVHIASDFIKLHDVVVSQQTTTGNDRTYTVEREGVLQQIPVIVLINGGSASAAEILSGALRDHKVAKLLGEKSFGKGSVQEPLDLQGGAGLHVTVAKWILPNGDWINGKGLKPDIAVSNEYKDGNTITAQTDTQLQKAIEYLVTK